MIHYCTNRSQAAALLRIFENERAVVCICKNSACGTVGQRDSGTVWHGSKSGSFPQTFPEDLRDGCPIAVWSELDRIACFQFAGFQDGQIKTAAAALHEAL